MKLVLALPLLATLAACGSSPGFVNSDVPEPLGMKSPNQQGVKFQGKQLMEGTLTYIGKGDIVQIYSTYIAEMRGLEWNLSATDGDSTKGYQLKFMKDVRLLNASIMPVSGGQADPSVQVTIKVSSAAGR